MFFYLILVFDFALRKRQCAKRLREIAAKSADFKRPRTEGQGG